MTPGATVTLAACTALAATAFSGKRLSDIVTALRIVVETSER